MSHITMRRRFDPGRWYFNYLNRRIQGFGVLDAARPGAGRACGREKVYDVPVWLLGREIATVRVPGASADGAKDFALRYLSANLYPHKTAESAFPLPLGGREIIPAGQARSDGEPQAMPVSSPPE